MNLLYRALNEYDIACNPLMNGLASKKLIYDLTMSYLLENERLFMSSLNDKERDEYCKDNMMKYINTHQHKLKKMIEKRGSKITKSLSRIIECDLPSLTYLLYYLSTLNSHLSSGTRVMTDWISTSKDLESVGKYYQKQNIHKVAVLETWSMGVIDPNTLVVDLSSKEVIDNISCILNKKITEDSFKETLERVKMFGQSYLDVFDDKSFVNTNKKFVAFNYAVADNEVCIYRFYPAKNVVSVLEQLQIDLIFFDLFNIDYTMLDKEKQILELNKLKEILKRRIIMENDSYMFHVFKELYLENKNIDIVSEDSYERKRINHNRTKILNIASDIHNIQIKR